MHLWDLASGQQLQQLTLTATAYASAAAFSPNGRQAAACGHRGKVRLWDLDSGEEVVRLEGLIRDTFAVAFSPDGGRVIAGGEDNTLAQWDTGTGRMVHHFPQGTAILAAVFSSDGQHILIGGRDRRVRLVDAATGVEVFQSEEHRDQVNGVAISPDGRNALSASHDGTFRFWQLSR